MQNTTTRNSNAKQIEARIRKGIILTSGKKVAEAIGIHKSQITRWQSENGMIEKISRLLDAIGYDSPVQDIVITGEEVKELIKMLEHIRIPKKQVSSTTKHETHDE